MKTVISLALCLLHILLLSASIFAQTERTPELLWEQEYPVLPLTAMTATYLEDEKQFAIAGINKSGNPAMTLLNEDGSIYKHLTATEDTLFGASAFSFASPDELLIAGWRKDQIVVKTFSFPLFTQTSEVELEPLPFMRLRCIARNKDGKIALAGNQLHGDQVDYVVLVAQPNGEIAWQKSFGSPRGNDSVKNILPLSDGFILAGDSEVFGNKQRYATLMKMGWDGKNIWEKSHGKERQQQSAEAVSIGEEGQLVFAGIAENKLRITQLDARRDVLWNCNFDGLQETPDWLNMTLLEDKTYMMMGRKKSQGGSSMFFAFRLNCLATSKTEVNFHLLNPLQNNREVPVKLQDGTYSIQDESYVPGQALKLVCPKISGMYVYPITFVTERKVEVQGTQKQQGTARPQFRESNEMAFDTLTFQKSGLEHLVILVSQMPVENIGEFTQKLVRNAPPQVLTSESFPRLVPSGEISYQENQLGVVVEGDGIYYLQITFPGLGKAIGKQ